MPMSVRRRSRAATAEKDVGRETRHNRRQDKRRVGTDYLRGAGVAGGAKAGTSSALEWLAG